MPTQAWVISSSKISKMTQNGGGGLGVGEWHDSVKGGNVA